MRLSPALLVGLASFVGLAACATDPAPSPDAPAATASGGLVLGPDGLGRLGAETPFDTAAVRAALPAGFAVEVHAVETEAGRVPAIWALRDGLLVLEVFGGETVSRIDAASDPVAGPGGARVGQSFADAGGDGMDCAPGAGAFAGRAVCEDGGVRYVFAHAHAGDGLPDRDALAEALLERIVWTAE